MSRNNLREMRREFSVIYSTPREDRVLVTLALPVAP